MPVPTHNCHGNRDGNRKLSNKSQPLPRCPQAMSDCTARTLGKVTPCLAHCIEGLWLGRLHAGEAQLHRMDSEQAYGFVLA